MEFCGAARAGVEPATNEKKYPRARCKKLHTAPIISVPGPISGRCVHCALIDLSNRQIDKSIN